MRIRPKSSWTYLILILTCFFISQVQAGWMDDLKNKTKAAKDAITTADEAVNSADGAVNSANEAVNKAVQPAPSY